MYSNQVEETNNYPKAIYLSAGIMGALLLISFLIIIGSSMPKYGMGGIIVNYGTSPIGMGDDYMTVDEPSMDPNANETRPDKVDPTNEIVPTPSQQVTDKAVMTQDLEDAPAVVSNNKKPTNANETTVEKKDSKPTVNTNALYKGNKNNSTGKGDGTGTAAGNQGSNLGDPLASNYGEGGSGDGDTPLNLNNYKWVVAPKFDDNGQYAGVVAVEVIFGADGRVTHARVILKGTTVADRRAWDHVEAAMKGARLNTGAHSTIVGRKSTFFVNFKLR
jgi:hypothetical protein